MKPEYTEIERMGMARSVRSRPPRYFLLHTEEGNATAEGLAAYCNNTNNGVSYHYTLRDSILVDVVDTDYYSWSVLDANTYTINLCFAGSKAAWTRADWLKRENDIAIAAWIAVQDCTKYAMATGVHGPDRYAALKTAGSGISDHRFVTKALGIGNHTDAGNGFPWDVFGGYVRKFTNPNEAQEGDMNQQQFDTLNGKLDAILKQLGPWPQLGKNAAGQDLTLVDAVAEIKAAK